VKQYLKNMFYFDGNSLNTLVTSGKAIENKIVLSLNTSPPNNKFNYLPSFHDDQVFAQFGGPFLKNKIGMRAFSFDQVEIENYTPPLQKPELTASNISYKSLKISWKAVPNTTAYILEKKVENSNTYQKIAEFDANKTEFEDDSILNNTLYYYRIKALGNRAESDYSVTQVTTIAKLKNPELSTNQLSYKALTITWKTVQNATAYVLERKSSLSDTYLEIAKLDNTYTEYTDNTLQEKATYYYRLKAFGDRTESDYVVTQVTTMTKLSNPEVTTEVISYKSLKVTWKAVQNATSYILERKSSINDSYLEIAKLNNTFTDYTDISLQENTTYYYRLKALGEKAESDYVTTKGMTAAILGFEEEVMVNLFTLFPNPTKSQVTIKFKNTIHGKLSIINLSGQMLFEEDVKNVEEKIIPLNHYQAGIYIVMLKNEQGSLMKKLIIE
jgi:Secretion system C-terminal sorting domain